MLICIATEMQLPKRGLDLVLHSDIAYYVIKNFVSYAEAKNQCKKKFGGKLVKNAASVRLIRRATLKQYRKKTYF